MYRWYDILQALAVLWVKQLWPPHAPCVGQYKEGRICRHQHCALSVTGEENGQHCSTMNVPAHVLKQPTCVWINGKIWIKHWHCEGSLLCCKNISNVSKHWVLDLHVHLVYWWKDPESWVQSGDTGDLMMCIVIWLSGWDARSAMAPFSLVCLWYAYSLLWLLKAQRHTQRHWLSHTALPSRVHTHTYAHKVLALGIIALLSALLGEQEATKRPGNPVERSLSVYPCVWSTVFSVFLFRLYFWPGSSSQAKLPRCPFGSL